MSTETQNLHVGGIDIDVVRKDIKNLHLGVYPPEGRVRVAVPLALDDEAVRLAVIDKLAWIRRQRRQLAAQPRQSHREMINRESHWFLGRRYLLDVVEVAGPAAVALRGVDTLELRVRPASSAEQRRDVLQHWYRRRLRAELAPLVDRWQQELDVELSGWTIKRMRTRWGGCNTTSRRAWFNLELVKTSPDCLDYIVLHELVHLLERSHNDRFIALMDQHMPRWRQYREQLNATALSEELWNL